MNENILRVYYSTISLRSKSYYVVYVNLACEEDDENQLCIENKNIAKSLQFESDFFEKLDERENKKHEEMKIETVNEGLKLISSSSIANMQNNKEQSILNKSLRSIKVIRTIIFILVISN